MRGSGLRQQRRRLGALTLALTKTRLFCCIDWSRRPPELYNLWALVWVGIVCECECVSVCMCVCVQGCNRQTKFRKKKSAVMHHLLRGDSRLDLLVLSLTPRR